MSLMGMNFGQKKWPFRPKPRARPDRAKIVMGKTLFWIGLSRLIRPFLDRTKFYSKFLDLCCPLSVSYKTR